MPSVITSDPLEVSASVSTLDSSSKNVAQEDTQLPSKTVLDHAANYPVVTAEGKKVAFRSLYWVGPGRRRRILILFIRHFFCGNCQEFVRSLRTQVPPDSLPDDLSIAIIGCGSHTLIASYITETDCPYPIYADHSQRLYDVLGMHRSLSLGRKDPDYIHHTLVAGMMKSIVQSVKRFPSGDALSGGDMRLNGGEFLFMVEGGTNVGTSSKGNAGLKTVSVTWCHRMTNSRDHTEIEQLRAALGLRGSGEASKNKTEA